MNYIIIDDINWVNEPQYINYYYIWVKLFICIRLLRYKCMFVLITIYELFCIILICKSIFS